MSEPTVVPPGGGEVIGDSPDRRVELLAEPDAVHVTWSRFAAGRDGADPHIHRLHTDIFYVLAGELTVRLGHEDRAVIVPSGRFACVPPLVVHGFRNAGDEEVRYLNFHAPGTGFADYMRGLREGQKVAFDQEDPPEEGVRPASEAAIGERVDVDAITIDVLAQPQEVETPALRAYYVLEGELVVGGVPALTGTWVQVPGGVAHSVELPEPARYLAVSSGARA
jgi:quercetin dioxygenase-like cupin family protein